MSRLKKNGLLYGRRFVDDTFAIVEKDANVEKIIDILNSFDNCIVFTFEEEVNNSLPFLDIYITRLPNNISTRNTTNAFKDNSTIHLNSESPPVVVSTNNSSNNAYHIAKNFTSFNTHHNLKIKTFINTINDSKRKLFTNLNNKTSNISSNNQNNLSKNNNDSNITTSNMSNNNSEDKSNKISSENSIAIANIKSIVNSHMLVNENFSNDINNISNLNDPTNKTNSKSLNNQTNQSNNNNTSIPPSNTSNDSSTIKQNLKPFQNLIKNSDKRLIANSCNRSDLNSVNDVNMTSNNVNHKDCTFNFNINSLSIPNINLNINNNLYVTMCNLTSNSLSENSTKNLVIPDISNTFTHELTFKSDTGQSCTFPVIKTNGTSLNTTCIKSVRFLDINSSDSIEVTLPNNNNNNNNNTSNNSLNCPTNFAIMNSNRTSTNVQNTNTLNFTNSFSTTIYRKPTYSGLITKWKSFVPHSYKVSTISSMVYRAIRICSSYQSMHEEFEFIEFIGILNGYPIRFIQSQIRKTFNRYLDKINGTQTNKSTKNSIISIDKSLNQRHIFLDLPFVGKPTDILKKQITQITRTIDPKISLLPIQRPPTPLSQYFPIKDKIPKLLKSKVVYRLDCLNCDATYIGKTIRHVSKKLHEHGAEFNLINEMNSNVTISAVISETLRRSERNKNKIVHYYSNLPNIESLLKHNKLPQSSVKQHEINNGHRIDWNNFDILARDNKNYQLLIKESLLINNLNPTLNRTTSSAPLIIFPERLKTHKPKVKIKSTGDSTPPLVVVYSYDKSYLRLHTWWR